MADDTYYSSWDENTEEWNYYRAKKGGKLYVNAWYKEDAYNWHYYGAEGKAVKGLKQVDGKQYYFYEDGYRAVNTEIEVSGETYIIDDNGIAVLRKDGWNKIGENWYYYNGSENLTNQVTQIDGSYYGFDWEGRMYDNTTFDIYDSETGENHFYRAVKGGSLIVDAWYQSNGRWYYYGEAGKAVSDRQTISGKNYRFDYQGMMETDKYFAEGEYLYYVNNQGIENRITAEGIYRSSEIYYVSGGTLLKNAWKQVEGKYYYFDEGGRAYRARFAESDVYEINGKNYAFALDGIMHSNTWVFRADSRYYATSSGALLTGEQKIDGKWYYFDNNGRAQKGVVAYNNKLYLCGSDGAYIGTVNKDGWSQINGTWYYIENGEVIKNQIHQIKGDNYYFDYDGKMMNDYIHENYLFNSSGKQVTSGWYMLRGKYVYVDPSTKQVVQGEKTINGKEYYFDGYNMVTGEILVGDELRTYGTSGALISKTSSFKDGWTLFNGIYYYYKDGSPYTGWVGDYYIDYGRMLTNQNIDGYWVGKDGKYIKNGWVECDSASYDSNGKYFGSYAYAKNNGKLARNEWQKIGGNWYYFNDYYRMVTGLYLIDGSLYRFAESGKMTETIASKVKDGWIKVGTSYAYISGGKLLAEEMEGYYKIDGTYYAFREGLMVQNDFVYGYYTSHYGAAYFGSNGKMVEYSGWEKIDGKWYYFDAEHVTISGMRNIDGKTYLLNPYMVTGWNNYGDHLFEFDKSGALINQDKVQQGWIKKEGTWYYMKDGYLVSGIHTINGKTYGFEPYIGKLVSNMVINGYFFDQNGVLATSEGWKKDTNGYDYYTDGNGKVYTGIHKINNTTYYFNEAGERIR